MAPPAIISKNISNQIESISADNENPDLPISNVLDDAPANVYEASTSGTASITVDFPTQTNLNTIAVVNHNVAESDPAVTIDFSNNDFTDFDSHQVTWSTEIMYITGPFTYKSFRLNFNTAQKLRIGQIYPGTIYQMTQYPDDITHTPVFNFNVPHHPYGQKNASLLSFYWRKTLTFSNIYKNEFLQLVECFKSDSTQILIIDTDTRGALQGRLVGGLESKEKLFNQFNLTFEQNPYEMF